VQLLLWLAGRCCCALCGLAYSGEVLRERGGAAVCVNIAGCRLMGVNLPVSVVTVEPEVQNPAGHNDLD